MPEEEVASSERITELKTEVVAHTAVLTNKPKMNDLTTMDNTRG